MRLSITTPGMEKLVEELRRFGPLSLRRVLKVYAQIAVPVITDIQRSMKKTPKSDKKYKRTKLGKKSKGARYHFSSKPDHPPAVDYGNLFNSLTFEEKPLHVEIGTDSAYARIHEFGWFKGKHPPPRLPRRPFIKPALERWEPEIIKRVSAAINREIK